MALTLLSHAQAAQLAAPISLERQCAVAAGALAEVAAQLLGGTLAGRTVVVLLGAGRLGRLALAAAHRLQAQGATVRLVLARPPTPDDAALAQALDEATASGLAPWWLGMSDAELAVQPPIPWDHADLLVDALLGPALADDPAESYTDLIHIINSSRRPILALEVPSGLGGDEGMIFSPCVEATATLALGGARLAHAEGWPVVGELWLAPFEGPELTVQRLGSARGLGRG